MKVLSPNTNSDYKKMKKPKKKMKNITNNKPF